MPFEFDTPEVIQHTTRVEIARIREIRISVGDPDRRKPSRVLVRWEEGHLDAGRFVVGRSRRKVYEGDSLLIKRLGGDTLLMALEKEIFAQLQADSEVTKGTARATLEEAEPTKS